MTDSRDRHVAYVRQANEELKGFVEGLVKENDRLTFELARAQKDLAAAERRASNAEAELAAQQAEQDKLMTQVEAITSDNTQLHARLTEVITQSTDITNLYVSSHQLHSAATPEEVLQAVHEIVINIVGSEEFVILERTEDDGRLRGLQSFGLPEDEVAEVASEPGDVVREILEGGELYLPSINGGDPRRFLGRDVTACVPLTLGGRVTGVVVIFSLLPQKKELTLGDRELFDLITAQAAGALHICREHARSTQ